ncbi:MAG: phosphomannomutase/phosphoglucomutase [Clostridia bacterium]|nr:phosphomannomutase/phosphoglucomutase [Clostridia bacterium]
MKEKWKKLQNGSDIRGIALEGIEGQHVNLTPEAGGIIAEAFALWLAEKVGKNTLTVAVGNDSRLSADALRGAVVNALKKRGVNVVNCGLASTPAMFMTTVTEGYMYDGSVMLTASHLPFNRNGLKFFTKDGGLEKADITKILEIADAVEDGACPVTDGLTEGSEVKMDFISVYAAGLVSKIRNATGELRPLAGTHIIVDAGNGAGGFYAEKVLRPLGADTSGSQFLEPDGSFPNHIPNPEDKNAMDSIQRAVLENKADFGIIFDTDVDRAGAVDRHGKEINRNRIIAMISAIAIAEHPGATIVTDSITSSGLKKFIEQELGGVHHRFKRGYKNVINEAIRLNNEGVYTPVAIETSGHGALKENYFLDDGAYLIAKLLIQLALMRKEGRHIDELIDKLEEPAEAVEFRLNIADSDFKAYGQSVIDSLGAFVKVQPGWQAEEVNYEGLRVRCENDNERGWFLLRLSLHDPLLPLNIESDVAGGNLAIARKLAPFFKGFEKLDSSSICAFAGN